MNNIVTKKIEMKKYQQSLEVENMNPRVATVVNDLQEGDREKSFEDESISKSVSIATKTLKTQIKSSATPAVNSRLVYAEKEETAVRSNYEYRSPTSYYHGYLLKFIILFSR